MRCLLKIADKIDNNEDDEEGAFEDIEIDSDNDEGVVLDIDQIKI